MNPPPNTQSAAGPSIASAVVDSLLDQVTLLVNSHSTYSDVWPMFLGQLGVHAPFLRTLFLVDDQAEIRGSAATRRCRHVVRYSTSQPFTAQYKRGLDAVRSPFVLTCQEDYILYRNVSAEVMAIIVRHMIDNDLVYYRLIHSAPELSYSMQATLWKTGSLRDLYSEVRSNTPWTTEPAIDQVLKERQALRGEIAPPVGSLRGTNHYDSACFPYIATALVKGKWNFREYVTELAPLLAQYNIDVGVRGVY